MCVLDCASFHKDYLLIKENEDFVFHSLTLNLQILKLGLLMPKDGHIGNIQPRNFTELHHFIPCKTFHVAVKLDFADISTMSYSNGNVY